MFEKRIAVVAALLVLGVLAAWLSSSPPPSSSPPLHPQPVPSSSSSSILAGDVSHTPVRAASAVASVVTRLDRTNGATSSAFYARLTGGSAVQRSAACESKVCGCALADKFGLRFEVAQQRHAAVADGFEYRVVVGQTAGNTSDLSWSARAVSKQWMSAPDAEASVARTSGGGGKYLAEWHFLFWLPSSSSSAPSLSYDIEITLTWINDRITGAKWLLPSRDDNPPLPEKKRKCLALELVGDCDRFGIPVVKASVSVPAAEDDASARRRSLAPCSTPEDLAGNGAWRRVPDAELAAMGSDERELLDDFVGLNRFDGAVWMWTPRRCALKWFRRSEALAALLRGGGNGDKPIRQITYAGDSMVLEQFLNLRRLLAPGAAIRSFRQQKLRAMSFVAQAPAGQDDPQQQQQSVTVTFLRSYTTSGGRSVLASPAVITSQVHATRPDVIVGNFAILHYCQNLRSLKDWRDNINVVAKRLCGGGGGGSAEESAEAKKSRPSIFFWSPTLIQMGRTQGLQPHRTMALSRAAEDAFRTQCGAGRAAAFWTYNASIARRESAHDGQHWACYREFGGVAATFTQMFLNALLN